MTELLFVIPGIAMAAWFYILAWRLPNNGQRPWIVFSILGGLVAFAAYLTYYR